MPVAVTAKVASEPGLTVRLAGWVVMLTGALTETVAALLVLVPAIFVTATS